MSLYRKHYTLVTTLFDLSGFFFQQLAVYFKILDMH